MTAPKPKAPATAPKGAKGVAAKVRADWEAVERDYRTTNMTLRELGVKHGVTHSAVAHKAKDNAWKKDLTAAVRQATNALLIEQEVTKQVTNSTQTVTGAVMAVAEMNKNVIMSHRIGLNHITEIKRKLLDQIEQAAMHMVDLAEVIEMVRKPDDNGMDRANDALKKAMGRSALVDDLKKLADVDEKVRKGEREAFKIDDAPESPEKDQSRYTDAERAVKLAYLMAQVPE
jgi:preprotein translocase subunit Sec63